MPNPRSLERLLATFPSVLVGYSGGVDSTLVAVLARSVLGRERAAAAIGISASLPREQLRRARRMARHFDLGLVEVETHELNDPFYRANSRNRCYYCKRELWGKLTALARDRDIAVVADGTNADDTGEHRPGAAAGREFGVRSPLAEVGYGKDRVRAAARELGIPVWDAPAAPCLSSRVLYGLEVTRGRLGQVERCEALLRELGVAGDLRVRHRGDEARIEVAPSEFDLIRDRREVIARSFTSLGFRRVTLDLRGYRRGSLLSTGDTRLEQLALSPSGR